MLLSNLQMHIVGKKCFLKRVSHFLKKNYFCFLDNKPPTVISNEATSLRKTPISLMVSALRKVTLPRDGFRLGKVMMFLRIKTKIKRPSTQNIVN